MAPPSPRAATDGGGGDGTRVSWREPDSSTREPVADSAPRGSADAVRDGGRVSLGESRAPTAASVSRRPAAAVGDGKRDSEGGLGPGQQAAGSAMGRPGAAAGDEGRGCSNESEGGAEEGAEVREEFWAREYRADGDAGVECAPVMVRGAGGVGLDMGLCAYGPRRCESRSASSSNSYISHESRTLLVKSL